MEIQFISMNINTSFVPQMTGDPVYPGDVILNVSKQSKS